MDWLILIPPSPYFLFLLLPIWLRHLALFHSSSPSSGTETLYIFQVNYIDTAKNKQNPPKGGIDSICCMANPICPWHQPNKSARSFDDSLHLLFNHNFDSTWIAVQAMDVLRLPFLFHPADPRGFTLGGLPGIPIHLWHCPQVVPRVV